jgi:hypothetical protein
MKHLALVIALAALSTSAFAEGAYQNEAELRLVQNVSVKILDEVKDGCLSNPNALKVEAELILRRSGVRVDGANVMSVLLISVIGWEMRTANQRLGKCVVHTNVDLYRLTQAPEGHETLAAAYRQYVPLAGATKLETQEETRASVSEVVSDLANEILKAQGN